MVLGNTYTSSQSVMDTIIGGSLAGCDSITQFNIVINSASMSNQTLTSCNSANINGTVYASSQIVTDVLTNANGCDSVVVTDLTIFDSYNVVVRYFNYARTNTYNRSKYIRHRWHIF